MVKARNTLMDIVEFFNPKNRANHEWKTFWMDMEDFLGNLFGVFIDDDSRVLAWVAAIWALLSFFYIPYFDLLVYFFLFFVCGLIAAKAFTVWPRDRDEYLTIQMMYKTTDGRYRWGSFSYPRWKLHRWLNGKEKLHVKGIERKYNSRIDGIGLYSSVMWYMMARKYEEQEAQQWK